MSTSEQTIRVGVAGLGYWGPNLARNFAMIPGCELTWLCDASDAALAKLSRAHPSARTTADLQDLLDDPELDAVVLATPVPTHAELATRVLEAGKHCFVEKPLATTAADAQRAVDAAERADSTLMVGHLLEYHPAVERLQGAARRGASWGAVLRVRQPPEPRQAALGRERPVEPRRARRLGRTAL